MISGFNGEYRWLSNFWPCQITYEGIAYASVEHAYQAAKTLDPKKRQQIADLPSPGAAKRAGKDIVLRPDWEKVKLRIMKELLELKFNKHEHLVLCDMLRQTKGQELVEDNNWGDTFWGICKGQGKNHLGKLLMEVRDSAENSP